MSIIAYNNHNNQEQLFIENIALNDIIKQHPTPFYCYSKKAIIDNYKRFDNAFIKHNINNYKICYAIKANFNPEIIKILAQLNSGIDAVSAGEIAIALKCGINPSKIVFAGVGKTKDEIEFALNNNILEFAVESIAEMHLLNEIAKLKNKKVKFHLRVNPDISAKTHDKISTGRKSDKFGVDIDLAFDIYQQASKLSNLEIYGISTHIGSQITEIEPFVQAFAKISNLCQQLKNANHNIQNIDLGGGIGIKYNNESLFDLDDYFKIIANIVKKFDVKITIAPGRAIMGNAGVLVSNVTYIKETESKNFAIIDAGMNDLARPGLYDSYHNILLVNKITANEKIYDFAGPICETTDILAKNRKISKLKANDKIVICDAGAYGSSMSSQYNCRGITPEILVDDNNFKIIRKKQSFDDIAKII